MPCSSDRNSFFYLYLIPTACSLKQAVCCVSCCCCSSQFQCWGTVLYKWWVPVIEAMGRYHRVAPVLPTTTALALSQLSTSSVSCLFSWIPSTEQRMPRRHITPIALHVPDFLSFDSGILGLPIGQWGQVYWFPSSSLWTHLRLAELLTWNYWFQSWSNIQCTEFPGKFMMVQC